MNIKELIQQAKAQSEKDNTLKRELFFRKTIGWFQYLGLLRHNKIKPQRFSVTLQEALRAGELEPRVLELIPAILIVLPKALNFKRNEIPADLAKLIEQIRMRKECDSFRGIEARNILHWLRAPVLDVAKRRIDFHRMPRRSALSPHSIGEVIRTSRIERSLTQAQLAKKYNLSLRIIRDLEQGKLNASLKSVMEILQVFGRQIKV